MTLRTKLLLALAPMAAVLVLFGVASVTAISTLGRSPGLILKDNYRSVLAAQRMLQALDARPLLELDLRLGEGTGATLALYLLEAAARVLAEMATFEDAGVTDAGR